jgi:hypothetical protein
MKSMRRPKMVSYLESSLPVMRELRRRRYVGVEMSQRRT